MLLPLNNQLLVPVRKIFLYLTLVLLFASKTNVFSNLMLVLPMVGPDTISSR